MKTQKIEITNFEIKNENPYESISNLSLRAEKLKNENEILKQNLFSLVISNNQNPFFIIKKSLLALSAKLSIREKETLDFSKLISLSKKNLLNSFIDQSSLQDLKSKIDFIASNLLISNQQKAFFNIEEIKNQNEELKFLINNQNNQLEQYKKRIQLYQNYYLEKNINSTILSLKKGEKPIFQTDFSLNQVEEQKMKLLILKKELKNLINKRKFNKNLIKSPRRKKK